MKIILTLFGLFLAARCLPAPDVIISQQCKDGKCGQVDIVDIDQKCQGGKCHQKTGFGVDFSKDSFFSSSSSDSDSFFIQNCRGSSCKQETDFRRKKRAVTVSQQCKDGKCGQETGFAGDEDVDVDIDQKCQGGKCHQKTGFGVDFSLDPFFSSSSSDSDTFLIQHCQGSNCKQETAFERKKRTVSVSQEYDGGNSHIKAVGDGSGIPVDQKRGGEQEKKTFMCSGGVVSSSCDRSVCQITCSDNTQYQHACGSQTSKVSSTSGTDGKTVVTVSCGGDPITYPSCFPFCSDSDSPPTTTLKSCIDACPVNTNYRGCVASCLNNKK